MRYIEGACHCGNITFTFEHPSTATKIPVRACGYDFCRKHGGVRTSQPDGVLNIVIQDEGELNRYSFATATAHFLVCRDCGVTPCVVSIIDDHAYAVVNVNSFENISAGEPDISPSNFDGEEVDTRLQRRMHHWISLDVA